MKWFICEQELVKGPLNTEQVKAELKSGAIARTVRIWGRSQEHWLTIPQWEAQLPSLLQKQQGPKDLLPWHYSVEGETYGPFPKQEMVRQVAALGNKNSVLLWTKGMPNWAPLHDFPELMDELGISRRQHPRTEIDGSIVITSEAQAHIGQLCMISSGGCGVNGVTGLRPGEEVHVEIKSKVFQEPIRVKAEVRYIDDKGLMGLKFNGLHMEAQNRIIEYIKGSQAQGRAA